MKSFIFSFSLFFLSFSIFAQNTQDEQAIRDLVKTMADGWTAGSGEQFASVFADQHDFIVWTGYYMKNSDTKMNARAHQGIFDTMYKDTEHFATIDKIKFIRKDVALIHVLAAVAKKGEGRPANPDVLWTGLLTKDSGKWKIVSFHNLDLEVFENENILKSAPAPPTVMYASWYESK